MKKFAANKSKSFRAVLIAACLAALFTTSACGVTFGSVTDRVCTKFDECNALSSGYSEYECQDDLSRNINNLSRNTKADWETQAERCLEFRGCSTAVSCLNRLLK